jgi:hypothetical protein
MDCSHRDLGRFEGVCGEADGGVMRDTLLDIIIKQLKVCLIVQDSYICDGYR